MTGVQTCALPIFDVKVATHIPGIENFRCDELSRLRDSKKNIRTVMNEIGLRETDILDIGDCNNVQQLIEACNPGI